MNSKHSSQASAPHNVLPTAVNRLPEVTIRREFKICGQIGEKGPKDRPSYPNAMHQIDRGLNKGHLSTPPGRMNTMRGGCKVRSREQLNSWNAASYVQSGHFSRGWKGQKDMSSGKPDGMKVTILRLWAN